VTIVVENSSGFIVTHRETDMRMTAASQSCLLRLERRQQEGGGWELHVVISANDAAGTRRL